MGYGTVTIHLVMLGSCVVYNIIMRYDIGPICVYDLDVYMVRYDIRPIQSDMRLDLFTWSGMTLGQFTVRCENRSEYMKVSLSTQSDMTTGPCKCLGMIAYP